MRYHVCASYKEYSMFYIKVLSYHQYLNFPLLPLGPVKICLPPQLKVIGSESKLPSTVD